MGQSEALTIARRYADAVVRELDPQQVVLYGSYARGTAHNESDIDIAIVFQGFTGDFWKTSSLLWRLTRNLSTTIEPILLDTQRDPTGFADEVIRTGRVIYQKAS